MVNILYYFVFYISEQYCDVYLIVSFPFSFFFLLNIVLRFCSALIYEIGFKSELVLFYLHIPYVHSTINLSYKISPQSFAAVSILEYVILCIFCRVIFVMYF